MNIFELQQKIVDRGIIQRNKQYVTSEMRAYNTPFIDPLTLNFKLMIDWDRVSGLLADEKNINSALAYLKRIGEQERYVALQNWIHIFKQFVTEYDFLLMSVEGIDEIINKKPCDAFLDDAKVTFNFNETIDMRCQALLTTYRQIWYDETRHVEVLPGNLRSFDIHVLIYNSGYFNMLLYDSFDNFGTNVDPYDTNYETKMFPTIRKLSDKFFDDTAETFEFNNHLLIIEGCSINNEESGKKFFETLSNEPGDEMVKNSITLNYKFASYSGMFANIMGDFNLSRVLKIASLASEQSKQLNFFQKLKGSFIKEAVGFANNKRKRILNYANLVKTNSVIGNALKDLSNPDFYAKTVRNFADYGFDTLENMSVNKLASNINSIVMKGFSPGFLEAYRDYIPGTNPPKIKLAETKGREYSESNPELPISSDKKVRGINFDTENIYNKGKENVLLDAQMNIYNRNGF